MNEHDCDAHLDEKQKGQDAREEPQHEQKSASRLKRADGDTGPAWEAHAAEHFHSGRRVQQLHPAMREEDGAGRDSQEDQGQYLKLIQELHG